MDYGKDFYATISFSDVPKSDGRRIWMGWISNWLYANEEPTETWRGAQSVPRVLQLRRLPEGIRLVQAPVAEIDGLRTGPETGDHAAARRCRRAPTSGSRSAGRGQEAGLRLSNAAGEEIMIGVRASGPELFVDRRRSRATAAHEAIRGTPRGACQVARRASHRPAALRPIRRRSLRERRARRSSRIASIPPRRSIASSGSGGEAPEPARASMWELRSVWETR